MATTHIIEYTSKSKHLMQSLTHMVVQHLESNLAQSKQLLAETKCTGYVQAARPIEQGQLGVLTS